MTLTAAQALGTGPTITLSDCTEVPLTYNFRSLALLEQRFGSITAIQDAMELAAAGTAFGPLMDMIGAGLASRAGGFTPHIRHYQDASGHRTVESILYRRSSDGTDLGELLAPGRVAEYADAMSAAFNVAFDTGGQGNDVSPVPSETTLSPGLS
ncbi:hypothetical protein [Kitasatospora sp. CB01950]|uniref:hypothetical protein n=1 Tax=Kitasatospora sp. CB01950 TaxID=1703930 RepID=UPI00093E1C58|nr:hypothetical protein [Kitasatospora sp. CB01950]OKJ06826.1 hypothetical protein AMK19_23545 [Kitasatospora sp. CB01950]